MRKIIRKIEHHRKLGAACRSQNAFPTDDMTPRYVGCRSCLVAYLGVRAFAFTACTLASLSFSFEEMNPDEDCSLKETEPFERYELNVR